MLTLKTIPLATLASQVGVIESAPSRNSMPITNPKFLVRCCTWNEEMNESMIRMKLQLHQSLSGSTWRVFSLFVN